MNKSAIRCATVVLAFSIGLVSTSGWTTRLLGKVITGQVTSMPAATQIEVDHQLYRIRTGTPAERNARNFHMGQIVDLELDSPSLTKGAQVVSIAVHSSARGPND